MKRMTYIVLALLLLLCSCGQPSTTGEGENNTPTWQEQYDLGIRYLSEGNYEEAIIAFTAAIEIAPKRAPAYVGRGNAYMLSGETEDNLSAAKADYEKALELDKTNAEAYLGLADVYIQLDDYDKALEVLRQGLVKISDKRLQERLDNLSVQEQGEEKPPENASNPVTAIGYIINNYDKYNEDLWTRGVEYTADKGSCWCKMKPYSIQFETSVDVQFDSNMCSIQEAEAGNVLKFFDDEELVGLYEADTETNETVIGKRIEMTGYFCPRVVSDEFTGPEYSEDGQTIYYYHPNGEYIFYIQNYTLLD